MGTSRGIGGVRSAFERLSDMIGLQIEVARKKMFPPYPLETFVARYGCYVSFAAYGICTVKEMDISLRHIDQKFRECDGVSGWHWGVY